MTFAEVGRIRTALGLHPAPDASAATQRSTCRVAWDDTGERWAWEDMAHRGLVWWGGIECRRRGDLVTKEAALFTIPRATAERVLLHGERLGDHDWPLPAP